jgi:trans-2,3-dihydro-3-hydroxyanthranilate isomerase
VNTDAMKIAREINFAESTFITKLDQENAQKLEFYSEHEMKLQLNHRDVLVLMNKVFKNQPTGITYRFPLVIFRFIKQEI